MLAIGREHVAWPALILEHPVSKQPKAATPEIYVAQMQIGSFWQAGDLVAADELLAIPGCDIQRLLDIGAIALPAEPVSDENAA